MVKKSMTRKLKAELDKINHKVHRKEKVKHTKFYDLKEKAIHNKEIFDKDFTYDQFMDLHQSVQGHIERNHQETLSQKVHMLTVWTMIFLPLSFLAAAYSMNFDSIPFADSKYGFIIFLVIITAVAVYIYDIVNDW